MKSCLWERLIWGPWGMGGGGGSRCCCHLLVLPFRKQVSLRTCATEAISFTIAMPHYKYRTGTDFLGPAVPAQILALRRSPGYTWPKCDEKWNGTGNYNKPVLLKGYVEPKPKPKPNQLPAWTVGTPEQRLHQACCGYGSRLTADTASSPPTHNSKY